MKRAMFRQIFLAAIFASATLELAHAADAPTVTAVLTSSETDVDRPVQLQIKITGDSSATPPNDITVDGLDIRYSGQSQLVEGRNFRFTYSFVYSYTILPLKAGTFTIPAQLVHTSSGDRHTPALTLNVASNDNNGGSNSSRSSVGAPIDERQIAIAEVIIPKTGAYLGETIPAEVRIGINSRVPHRLLEGPTLSGQGFTAQRLTDPKQTLETINGRSYYVFTFKTAITPARTGNLEITAKDARAVVQVTRRGGARPRSPYDVFGMDDPFSDPFFSDPFSAGNVEQRELKIASLPVSLEIKPLPANPPPSFSGAIGSFGLTTEVKPKRAQLGDPFTVKANISGRGNFDRVVAPALEDERGWHAYPPGASFKADDDVGLSGTKSFEMVLTPNEHKDSVPPLVFSYFDPLKDKYVTLKSDRMPIAVDGVAPAGTPAIASAGTAPSAKPTPTQQAEDILYQLTEQGPWDRTFAPLYLRPVFWAAQGLPLLGLIGFFSWEIRRRRQQNREGLRRAAWEHENAELQRKLRRGEDPPEQYFAEALRVVQLKTALVRRIEPNTVDAETAITAFDLSDEKQLQMRELFRQSDELRYSGRQNGNRTVAAETQREVLELIDSLS
jgi:hypothetical protein